MECGAVSILVSGNVIYPHRPDLFTKKFYLCPKCRAYCGCHPGSEKPLGQPCGPETRKARSAAHAAFDPIWKSRKLSRSSAYAWLSTATGINPARCHIGMMNADQARAVVAAVATKSFESDARPPRRREGGGVPPVASLTTIGAQ